MTKSYLMLLALGLISFYAAAPVAMAEDTHTTLTEKTETMSSDAEKSFDKEVDCVKEVVDGVEVEKDCVSHEEKADDADHAHDADESSESAE